MRPASLQVVTEDVRKLGIGAMGAGVLGLFAPSDKIALGDSVALFALGAIIWVTGIMLHALNELLVLVLNCSVSFMLRCHLADAVCRLQNLDDVAAQEE